MTHPLEELARWHDARALQMNRSGTESGRSQADHHTAFGSILRSAIPDCECGELVRETLAALPPNKEDEAHFSIEIAKYDGVTSIYTIEEAPSAPYEETDRKYTVLGSGPTLPTAVAAARANGAEGKT